MVRGLAALGRASAFTAEVDRSRALGERATTLARETGDSALQAAAENANRFNLSVQDPTAADEGVRGGTPGSHPLKGGYMKNRYPNWAGKFFMDALMLQLGAGQRCVI